MARNSRRRRPTSYVPCANVKGDGKAATARTAIDPRRGTADRHKLFHAEEVIPGTTFLFEALYLPSYANEGARRQLEKLLFLLQAHGLAAGRSTRAGQGRLEVVGEIAATRCDLGPGGDLEDGPEPDLARESLKRALGAEFGGARPGFGKSYELTLTGDGPFFVNDWSWKPDNDQKDKEAEKDPQFKALRESDTKPILPGPSLLGAMRARARWLAALAKLREDAKDPVHPTKRSSTNSSGHADARAELSASTLLAGRHDRAGDDDLGAARPVLRRARWTAPCSRSTVSCHPPSH